MKNDEQRIKYMDRSKKQFENSLSLWDSADYQKRIKQQRLADDD